MKLLKSSGKLKNLKLPRIFVRRIVGDSMTPALRPGSLIIAHGFLKKPKIDEIVIVRHDGLEKVKRIAKIRGQEIYVVGDNTAHSTDSRHFGWLAATSVRAKVIWPRFKHPDHV